MAMTHRIMMEVITMLSWKRWWARMIESKYIRDKNFALCTLGKGLYPMLSLPCGSYSMDFKDSAMLIFSSLKYIKPFTSMAKIKVNKRLSR